MHPSPSTPPRSSGALGCRDDTLRVPQKPHQPGESKQGGSFPAVVRGGRSRLPPGARASRRRGPGCPGCGSLTCSLHPLLSFRVHWHLGRRLFFHPGLSTFLLHPLPFQVFCRFSAPGVLHSQRRCSPGLGKAFPGGSPRASKGGRDREGPFSFSQMLAVPGTRQAFYLEVLVGEGDEGQARLFCAATIFMKQPYGLYLTYFSNQ